MYPSIGQLLNEDSLPGPPWPLSQGTRSVKAHNAAATKLALSLLAVALGACARIPEVEFRSSPPDLIFSGERALEIERQFVSEFPNRYSGQPNNKAAVEWERGFLEALGYGCQIDEWTVVNYSRPVDLNNLVCRMDGRTDGQIVVVAHHDHSPDTVQGADNDGSGVAILLHLAEIMADRGTPRQTLIYLSSDGEEYGMLGTRRFVETHEHPDRVMAAVSLDNLGKSFYDGLEIEANGQFRGYSPLWLQRFAQESARRAGAEWPPKLRLGVMQVLNQAVPVSFMDQGPFLTAGVPAIGIAGSVPAAFAERHWDTYHSPGDTLEVQSAETLGRSGRAAEAFIKSLLAQDEFPSESGPYVYLEGSGRVLRGAALYLAFLAILASFAILSVRAGRATNAEYLAGWSRSLPHFMGFWLPLIGSVLLTYLLVAVGAMQEFAAYPATPKDEPLFEPRWPAVVLFLAGTAGLLWLGRRLSDRTARSEAPPDINDRKRLAMLVITAVGVFLLLANPFSLIFLLPLFFWYGIAGRHARARWIDLAYFLLGGLLVYALVYFFGFVILRNGLAVLWYLLMMFSIRMISTPAALAITAALAAGLSLIITPAGGDPLPREASSG